MMLICGRMWTPTPPTDQQGTERMTYIALIAVIGILLLYAIGGIPLTGVGGAMTVGLALLVPAPAVGIHEAWTKKRGVLGWIANIVISLVGAFLFAPLGGMVIGLILSPFINGSSLAATGGPVMYVALAGMMLVTLLGAWGALWIVNRWR
jgi:hypothetical protein